MHRINTAGILFITLTIIFTVAGQLLVKKGTLIVGAAPTRAALLPRFIVHAFLNPLVVLGLGSAVVAAMCWTIAVSRIPLSVAYPFMSLSLVLVLMLTHVTLGETVAFKQAVGLVVVCAGLLIATL